MSKKIIPLVDERRLPARHLISGHPDGLSGTLADALQRPLRSLRISVTDRCNFRCVYCMPKALFDDSYNFLPRSALLSFEEIARIAKVFVAHGVRKIRLTGGEPLLRKNIEHLIEKLSALRCVDGGAIDLSLTTNGALLEKKARALKDAGLNRISVSLDALSDAAFKRMNDVNFPVADVLSGIAAAHQAGLGPIKVNMVLKRGMNEAEILPMARHFKGTPHILRFIEYMDVGASNGWRMDEVLPSLEVVGLIGGHMPLEAVAANHVGETARRWRYVDGGGEIGVISSVTHAFCQECSRVRLSTEGKVFTCLFASAGHDLRPLLRGGDTDAELSSAIARLWRARADRYSELARTPDSAAPARKIEMSYIGG